MTQMRRPCLFKERDVKRAGRAVLAMGLDIGRVEIDKNGTIVVIPGKPKEAADESTERNEWDDLR
jgi:hypothetical protein